jgi:two-component system, OmpR family, sensor histidine kinase KdpD
MEPTELSEVAATVAHELRNPIAAIRALAQTARGMYDGLTDDDRKEFFRLIDDEARRLARVADQTAMALKLEAGSVIYDRRPTELGPLIRDAAEAVPHDDHELRVETDHPLMANVDSTRVAEAVAELVDNAVKFSPPGSTVAVRARGRDGRAVIEVVDAGPGIPEGRRTEVFERFTRIRPPGYEDAPGPGLGLFIARGHVGAHGGRIDVAAGDEQIGTMLRIELPASR